MIGSIGELAGGADDALETMEIFANDRLDGEAEIPGFELKAQFRKQFGFKTGREWAELNFASGTGSPIEFCKFTDEKIAETDAGAGIIQAGKSGFLNARTEQFDLIGGGHVLEHEDFTGPELIADALESPADGEVMFAAEIDAEVNGIFCIAEAGCATGVGMFAGLNEIVIEEDGTGVREFAFVFLGPGFGIIEAGAEVTDINGQSLGDGIVNGDAMAGVFGTGPEVVEFIGESVGSADDAEFFCAAPERIGNAGVDRTPDFGGAIVEREFRENEIRGIATDSFRFRRKRKQARPVLEKNFRRVKESAFLSARFRAMLEADLTDFRPVFRFGEGLESLTFARSEDDPGGFGMEQTIKDGLGGAGKVFAGLSGPETDFESAVIEQPATLVGEKEVSRGIGSGASEAWFDIHRGVDWGLRGMGLLVTGRRTFGSSNSPSRWRVYSCICSGFRILACCERSAAT